MSLVNRLWIAVIVITLGSLLAAGAINILSARQYLADELKVKNMDTANALALSVSQQAKDRVTAELIVSAQFDLGHYRRIEYLDAEGRSVVRHTRETTQPGVPSWFVSLIPIEPPLGEAGIQAGWMQLGTIKLQSDPSFAYASLWQSVVRLLFWFVGGFGIVGLLGTVFIRSVIKPLTQVVGQAEALAERRFVEVPSPRTLEFRQIVEAMNRLTRKIKDILDTEASRLEKLKADFEFDRLTNFSVRDVFLKRLQANMEREDAEMNGLMAIVRLGNLVELNNELGRVHSDHLLANFAKTLRGKFADHPNVQFGRLNGVDLSIFLPGHADADGAVARIQQAVDDAQGGSLLKLSFGVAEYTRQHSLPELLAACDQRMISASAVLVPGGGLSGISALVPLNTQESAHTAKEWTSILETALQEDEFELAEFPVRDREMEIMQIEAPARIKSSVAGSLLVAGAFLPWARKLGQAGRIDREILVQAMVLAASSENAVCINVGFESVCDDRQVNALANILQSQPEVAKRICLDVTEDIAFHRRDEFAKFCRRLAPLGVNIGVEHLDHYIGQLGQLHNLGLTYVKISQSLVADISTSAHTPALLRGVCTVCHTMGLAVIAEGVRQPMDINLLLDIGFDGVTGTGVR